jgi:hypothetical protein
VRDYDLDQELHVFTEIHHTKGDLGAAIRLLTNARVISIEEAGRLSEQVEQVYPIRYRWMEQGRQLLHTDEWNVDALDLKFRNIGEPYPLVDMGELDDD